MEDMTNLEDMTMLERTYVSWGGWADDGPDSGPRARLFGELCNRAWPIVKHYRSDMYRVAVKLSRIDISRPMWFVAREYGAALCDGLSFMDGQQALATELSINNDAHAWKVTQDGRRWTIDKLDNEATLKALGYR